MEGDRAEDGVTGRLEDHGLLEMRDTHSAEILWAVDAEQASLPGKTVELTPQVLGYAVVAPARVTLEGEDRLAYEGAYLVAQLREGLWNSKIHVAASLPRIVFFDRAATTARTRNFAWCKD